MSPFADIVCDTFTTMTIDGNHLTILSSEDLSFNFGDANLEQVRFEVINGGELTFEPNARFVGTVGEEDDLPGVDGGALFIGTGSRVRFLNDFMTQNVGVRSIVDDGDFASVQLVGGCIWTDGYFRVAGEAIFDNCENSGGGESSPGPGGALWVGENAVVVFQDTLEIKDVSIIDDEGNNGAGFYNLGRVIVKGDSIFENLSAETAGAIFNGESATFKFKDGATAVFNDCRAFDGIAGSIFNAGEFKFSGAALFFNGNSPDRGGAIVVGETGEMILAEDTVFFNNPSDDPIGAPVFVVAGGSLTPANNMIFVNNADDDAVCDAIYFEADDECVR
ncbi:unnamed protein product [Sphacelaria rigidula]